MHLFNIMKQLGVPNSERKRIVDYFKDKKVSVSAVRNLLDRISARKESDPIKI
jgi:hypothetical protein